MDLFWVTCVIADSSGVWRCSNYDGFLTMAEAVQEIEFKRNNYPIVVSAFIEKTSGADLSSRVPVFAECYIGPLGIRI